MERKSNKRNIQVEILQRLTIPHNVVLAKTRRLTLKFNRDGILIIRIPNTMALDKMELFVEKHIDWIIKNYRLSKPVERKYLDGEEYLYLGKVYYLKIIENKHPGVHLNDNIMFVYVNNQSPEKIIDKWKKEEAEKIFQEIMYNCYIKMDKYFNKYPILEIKSYKARWGTCYPKKNKISLNISLIHVDVDLIEYVIFHELCHFIHLDHSKNFHDLLKTYIPDETKKRQRLKKYKCYYK